ncbi:MULTISPECIES: ribonuclease HII [Helcococcus]|uniref:Ribonuclease HII n=1 Tax=Helcococcus bovis TaxID=3153252 RepID=A0ABW9F6S1_9FIRM
MKIKLKRDQLDILLEKSKNYTNKCGIDEVGRGPIAGPVVSCAVIMGENHIDGVKDSKKLSDKKRRLLAEDIFENAIAIGYGIVDNHIIDEINIRQASLLAMKKALENLKDKNDNPVKANLALIDAELIDSDIDQIGIISGDDLVYEISCASILAKVYRDDMMIEYSKVYPEYMFEAHKGYGTKKHYGAIDAHGISEIHRISFMKKYYEQANRKIG